MSKKNIFIIVQLFLMATGMALILDTDAYYLPYLVVCGASIFCMTRDAQVPRKWHLLLSPALYGLVMLGANYPVWTSIDYPDEIGVSVRFLHSAFLILSIFFSGYFQAYHILKYICAKELSKSRGAAESLPSPKLKPYAVFLITFAGITALNLTVLFTCRYPGNVTADSLTQIKMFSEGWYNNHHPFLHTQTIRLFVNLGLMLFGDLNAGVAVYNVFQVLFMAACFSAAVMTLHQAFDRRWLTVTAALFFALMPFNINYSFSVWKDVMFGGFILLFVIYLFRCDKGIGLRRLNFILLAVASLGVCLFRSNGYIMFIIVVLTYLILFWKKIFTKANTTRRTTAIIFGAALIISYLFKHPFLAALDIPQPDTVEMLSIPLQQIARTLIEHDDLTEEDLDLIENVVSKDRMCEVYYPIYSDPEKDLIRHEGSQDYIRENKMQFAFLYIRLGLKYPDSYLKAWVDQTRGYWNSGYDYWRWLDNMDSEEGYDLYRTVNSDFFKRHFDEYLWIFQNSPVLILFLCIGLYVWIDWLLFYMAAARRDYLGVVLAMPVITLVFTLQISTPVYSEFRYVYSVFCSVPFLIPVIALGSGLKSAE